MSAGLDAAKELPTLQRNALSKLFSRSQFIPQEVAALGYERLRKAEGIGKKGIVIINEWLKNHGCELRVDAKQEEKRLSGRAKRELASAINIVRAHGYTLQRTDGSESQQTTEDN